MTVSGPLYRKRCARDEVVAVDVAPDDGLNHGFVSWPVAPVRGEQLIRLNMGGSASVTIRLTDGSRIQVVVHDETEAQRIAAAVG
ncbi:hypothetical protein [Gordonia phthalatica]|uniref:Uncharacterized protein n=1 Tax=Gordonia phthalatica TaxID=1136941 RepID=A0A0N9NAQ4_9ACTN|nr:hypothetical protein [Gordonia phthalatica]ALG85446.1 hypothetical protein ACH46_14400 [Gordonia phthalatica]